MMTKIMNRKAPKYLEDLFRPKQSKSSLVLRDAANKLEIPMPKTDCFKQSISYSGAASFFSHFFQLRVMSSDSWWSSFKLLVNNKLYCNVCILVKIIGIVL